MEFAERSPWSLPQARAWDLPSRELAAEGVRLIMCARNESVLNKSGVSIAQSYGTEVLSVAADLSKLEDIQRMFELSFARFGQVDILVTNSGGPLAGTFEKIGANDWAAAVNGLLMSAVEMSRLVLPGMKERRWGRILNITSIASKQPVEDLLLSNSIRAAVTGFAKTLAAEIAPFGITVNNIMPGYTATDRVQALAESLALKSGSEANEVRERWEREIPMGRLGRPDEFAAAAAFLVSDRASYITGASVQVDGGWTRSIF